MNQAKKNATFYALVLIAQLFLYKIMGYINGMSFQTERFVNVSLHWDSLVEFQAWAIWWYVLYYFILFVPFLLVSNNDVFQKFIKCFLMLTIIGDALYLLLPVTMPPFNESLDNSITGILIKSILEADTRGNCFPSLHCAHSVLIAFWMFQLTSKTRRLATTVAVMAFLVSVSTILIKQHWLVDVVGALVLVAGVLKFYEFEFKYQRV